MLSFTKPMWNDGPPLQDFMGSEGAVRIARKHLCEGGGGGSDAAAGLPDYGDYIKTATEGYNRGQGWASDLYDWAKKTGVDLMSIARTVSTKAGAAADTQQATADRLTGDWEKIYKPLYQAQADDAQRMIGDLPGTEEHYAGKFSADTSMAIDQAMQTQLRNMRAQGFNPDPIAAQAIGMTAGLQRAAALTAASETGRYAARSEARDVTGKTLTQGQAVADQGNVQAGLATGNRNQEANAPLAAASTSAGIYAPATNMYASSLPYLREWREATDSSARQRLEANKMNAENNDGGFMSTILPLAGGLAGSFFGPMGSAIGSGIGRAAGNAIGGSGSTVPGSGTVVAKGGRIPGRRYAAGGAIDTGAPMDNGNYVPPEASPSGGSEVDDVSAMVSAGEFVIPKRTVDWLGDKFFQKLIQKTDMEIAADTTAAPEAGPMPAGAIQTDPPMFRSEGARA